MTTLVVEDEALLRLVLCEAFEAAGLQVASASSAEQALLLLTTGLVPVPSVLVTDLNLGPGLDGVALAAEMRRRCPGVAVIYATGNASWLAGQSGTVLPGDQVFGKPYSLDALIEAVRAAAEPQRGALQPGAQTGWPARAVTRELSASGSINTGTPG